MGSTTGTGTEHRYQTCRDEGCERFPCRVYQEGRRTGDAEGYRRGFDEGYAAGYGAGYSDGFTEGLASCPGPHSGS